MICFPNAKINLGLNVVSKRPDRYHNIETIFYPIPLKDALEIVPATSCGDSFHQEGILIDGDPDNNLVIKALLLMRQEFNIPPLDIHLLKAIPFGAGLGGGSSDAAFMLKLINDFCKLNISSEKLEELAHSIGADCPFFIRNTPVFASGTGNIFTTIKISLKGYYICLVKPDIFVSTPEAYSLVKPVQPAISLNEIMRMQVEDWREYMRNDFEESVLSRHPAIGDIKNNLYKAGAVYASMSGSGSSVYGLFRESPLLKDKFPGCFVWEGEL